MTDNNNSNKIPGNEELNLGKDDEQPDSVSETSDKKDVYELDKIKIKKSEENITEKNRLAKRARNSKQ